MFSAASKTDNVSSAANYIEDVFSTYLYTGNGSTLAINNGVDLSTYGGLVWVKRRDATIAHGLWDTARGVGTGTSNATNKALATNSTSAEGLGNLYPGEDIDYLSAFATNGFTVKSNALGGRAIADGNGGTYVSWTFRKQPKFFDVVTWTGNGTNNRQISHALGSTPGCIIVKELNQTGEWYVYHRSNGTGAYMRLNSTASLTTAAAYFPAVSSTTFTPTSDTQLNTSTVTYVAYLFAHDAGGFGNAGTDNVISCGSYTGNGTSQTINLGYEPQWILTRATSVDNWVMLDNMRGIATGGVDARLYANSANAEDNTTDWVSLNATGYTLPSGTLNGSGTTYIYIAIRRGPMKTPTSGTSVYTGVLQNGSSNAVVTTNFPVDMTIATVPSKQNTGNNVLWDRLRGTNNTAYNAPNLKTNTLDAEQATIGLGYASNTSIIDGYFNANFSVTDPIIYWNFRRSPSFMDVVCYTGTGVDGLTINHNLSVVPEMIILKCRNNTGSFIVGTQFGASNFVFSILNLSNAGSTQNYGSYYGFYSKPTATSFALDGYGVVNTNGNTYVAYLFASCPGVSKVGSYTGTGGTQTISCGFAARFVLIKRIDDTGRWWVWDTARGMVTGTDPRLAINTQEPETNANWVYTNASGFQIVTTDATVNANGGSYIYLAIA